MTSSNDAQTIPLDQLADVPLDQFPEALQRVALSDVGLDGRRAGRPLALKVDPFTEQDRGDGIWSKIA